MSTSEEYRRLGMGRPIARRDFLNGVAIGITGAYAALQGIPLEAAPETTASQGAASGNAADYPPSRTGLRGDYPAAVAGFETIQQGKYAEFPLADSDLHEDYDLVIVGGGLSGLAAAYFYRTVLGPEPRILILDNHDDFGGHAKRNEFHHQGRTFIGFGGTRDIGTPYPYSFAAKALLKDLGIEVEKYSQLENRGLETRYHLGPGMFFDKEHFGKDLMVAGYGKRPWAEFFAEAPLSEAARQDLLRLHAKNPDYLAGLSLEEKKARLARMSYQDYLLNTAKMNPDALPFFQGRGWRNNKRVDTLPALEAAQHGGAGFDGLGLGLEESFNEDSFFFHFPDGNASIARLLVGKLIPAALPSQQSMESVVRAPLDYQRLDEPSTKTRIRLNSTVVRVQHDGSPENGRWVRVAYRQGDKLHGVRGRYCILACFNRLIPALLPELLDRQKEALEYPVKVPMLYTNVLVRRWAPFQKLGVAWVSAPGMYHTIVALDPGTNMGGYQGLTTPEEPIIVHMVRNPNEPGLPRKEQQRLGQQELLKMSFEEFELEVRRQLARMLAPAGFDAAEDIVAITVNRWPYGYAYTYDTLADPDVPQEERPHVVGRRRFGRVTIANSDAGGAAFTNQAFDEAYRAVQELLVLQGLT
ncbi:MAG: NAD(P)-binding protein [Candidatus Acidiferrales bacterium]